ncbi:MAG: MMPL family transporter [Actinomycetota bacterium]|nr:MMPL family transporter [Actinomycetota bacterium]
MHRQIAGKLTGRVTKWITLAAAVVLFVLMSGLNSKLIDVQNNEASSWLPGSAESTKVVEELTGTVDPNDIPTLVVYHRDGGLTPVDLDAMDDHGAEIAKVDGVTDEGVITPNGAAALAGQGQQVPTLVSEDGEVAYLAFTFNFGENGWVDIPDAADDVRDISQIDGVDVHIAGYGGQAADASEAFEGIDTNLILAALGVVIVILLLTYRSPILWLLPIISAVVSYMIAGGVVYLLAKYADLTVNGQSQSILGILVIGAGTDYALLLIARYREELRRHEDRHEAMAFALHRAAPAILASAATVVIGMLCLSFADLNSTAGLGPVLAVGVAVTFLVMVTLLPALLVITGRWVFWPKRPTFGSPEPTSTGLWAKLGDRIAPRPRAVWVVTAALLAIACLGLFKLDPSGLSTEETYTKKFDSIQGQSLLVDHGLSDTSNTVQVVANDAEIPATQEAIEEVDGLGEPTQPQSIGNGRSYFEATVGADISSTDAFEIVEDTRDAVHDIPGADALVGGGSAFYLDTKIASERDNRVIIPIVLVVVFLILVLLLRALIAPLILMGTVVLSFGAALGLSTLLFTEVFTRISLFESNDGFAHTDPGFPLFTFVFLVALGIDYNIFLMTRVREETAQHGTRRGSLIALSSTGGVITSAGLVLAATFLVLGSLPLVFLAQLGVAVALGVLLDTMIVRSVLVTAINLDLGGKIWWPSKLDRGGDEAPPPHADEQEKVLV